MKTNKQIIKKFRNEFGGEAWDGKAIEGFIIKALSQQKQELGIEFRKIWNKKIEDETNRIIKISVKNLDSMNEVIKKYKKQKQEFKKMVEKDLLIKCECENGDCPNCQKTLKLLDDLEDL